ncbi:30S ribosomal protein S13 [Candidatus Pacearchaeota archaeon]|nr:30S ribosomal protein S13 [Candidatus Pacearchaeota archaeon]
MAEKKQTGKSEKSEKSKSEHKPAAIENTEFLVRIYGYDIEGSRNIYAGLTRIKGVSWSISNAVCIKLNYSRSKKIGDLSKEDIVKIEEFLDKLDIPEFLKNRRSDRETGETGHFYGTDLDMKRDFDIKRMKEIKSYKGIRHASRLPVRGQRTRSHFRAKRLTGGGVKKAVKK